VVNRIVVGAGYGLRDWIAQRATAVIMAVYTVILLVAVVANGGSTFEAWHALFANGFMKFATFLALLSLFYHAWIGVRDIFMDYIKPTGLRLGLMVVLIAALVGYAGWAAQILWRL